MKTFEYRVCYMEQITISQFSFTGLFKNKLKLGLLPEQTLVYSIGFLYHFFGNIKSNENI